MAENEKKVLTLEEWLTKSTPEERKTLFNKFMSKMTKPFSTNAGTESSNTENSTTENAD